MAKIGQAMTRSAVIELANELIIGTEHAGAVIEFKLKRQLKVEVEDNRYVSTSWYKGFMKRNGDTLKRGQCRVVDSNRHTWCTYENFERMYDGVYTSMVEAGIAVQTDYEMMYDETGEETYDVSKMVGRPTKLKLKRPKYLLFADATGCNTNQNEDKYAGGELFALPAKESVGGVIGATSNIHFTKKCFTSALGDPVLCAVILKSDKHISELPLSWKLGIDIRRDVQVGTTRYEYFQANYGEGHVFAGGPTCTYNGVQLPCFVGCSPKASITSEMITAMLQSIDDLNVFDRSSGIRPVLLLDNHHSRMKLNFLQYANNIHHQWVVCLGVPYGTHIIWQVADASELNGCFKIAMVKAKREYIRHRQENSLFRPILSHWSIWRFHKRLPPKRMPGKLSSKEDGIH
jgi:hypothetical protein